MCQLIFICSGQICLNLQDKFKGGTNNNRVKGPEMKANSLNEDQCSVLFVCYEKSSLILPYILVSSAVLPLTVIILCPNSKLF